MSSKLKPLDLTGAPVGFQGTIDFNQFVKAAPYNPSLRPGQQPDKAHIRLLNESGCGVDIVFQASGNSHSLPAGAWGTFDIEPNDGSVAATVTYILPNPPVSSLMAIYYAPGETVPASFTLGNSPIGIGGTVNTVGGTASSIQNDGNGAGTSIVEATVTGDGASAVKLTNDANFTLGDTAHKGSLLLASGKLGMNAIGDMLDAATVATETHLNATGGDIVFETVIASVLTEIARFVNSGMLSLPGKASALLTGSSSGTAQAWMILNNANFKLVFVYQNAFKNGTSGQQFLSIPPPVFTTFVTCLTLGGSNSFNLVKTGTAQTINVLTTLATPAGSSTATTNAGSWVIGTVNSGIDTIAFNGLEASSHVGGMLLYGQ